MSDTNKEREAFEAWYADKCSSAPKLFGRYQDPDDPSAWLYLERAVDDAWFVWKGARSLAAPMPQSAGVTEFNVGAHCLSEDDCIEQGINFSAYERGVNDAAEAFGRNRRG